MNTSIDNPGFLARQQEQQTLPKILAYGIGGSLVFHGIAAIAFNYLPQHNSLPVEVTIIDPSEIPANLKPSPSPTITPPPKIKSTPALVAKATPTPRPSVEIKPMPTPTPSVEIKPAPIPTPAVKVKPDETPPVVKIVTRPAVPVIPTRKEPEQVTPDDFNQQQNSNLKSKIDPVTQQNQRDQNFADRQIPPLENNSNDLSNGTQFSSRDAGRSNKIAKLFSAESDPLTNNGLLPGNGSNQNDTLNDLVSPGGENGNQGATPENLGSRNGDKIATSRTGGGIPGLAGDGGSGGVSSDNGAEDVAGDGSPGGGGSSRSNSGGTGGGGGNGSYLKPGQGSKSGGGFSNGSGLDSDGFRDSSGFDIALAPGGSGGGSRSNSGGTGGNNGSSLKPSRGGKPGGSFGNGSGFGGDGYGDGSGSDIALIPGGSGGGSRSNPSGIGAGGGNGSSLKPGRSGKPGGSFGSGNGGGLGGYGDGDSLAQNGTPGNNTSQSGGVILSSKGFGSGLQCIANCQPSYPQEIESGAIVFANITLDDRGQVIATKLSKPSKNRDLNSFAETEFGRMQFNLPANVTTRNFRVTMKFEKTR
jgi:hypothetical protein